MSIILDILVPIIVGIGAGAVIYTCLDAEFWEPSGDDTISLPGPDSEQQ